MKKYSYTFVFLLILMNVMPLQARKQWTEKQAWAWEKQVGVIKGFNEPYAFPGVTLDDMFKKASEVGLNSVRLWPRGKTAEDQIAFFKSVADKASKHGLTLSPVLCVPIPQAYWDSKGTDETALKTMKEYTQKMIGAFAKDKRFIMWDLWNEPGCGSNFAAEADENFMMFYRAIDKMVDWAYEMNPMQAMTSSIFWRDDLVEHRTDLHKLAWEVERKMDVHNFHNYGCCNIEGVQREIDCLRKIGNRPIVCTECLTRVNNSGLSRTFAIFAKNNIHFYQWGLFLCERNWTTKWGLSAYDPYDPTFHNLLRPDGEPIDFRDVQLIRDYKFTNGVETDEGAEFTDRWESQRAWRWMSLGPVKGQAFDTIQKALEWLAGRNNPKSSYWRRRTWTDMHGGGDSFNSLNVKLSYADFKADKKAFFAQTDSLLKAAKKQNMTTLFTLLDDDDLVKGSNDELTDYAVKVTLRYYSDPRVKAWDVYYHPGQKASDVSRLTTLTKQLFRDIRIKAYPNQPLMSTPMVKAKPFKEGFDYRDAFVHGRRNGWNLFDYEGCATAELCFLIWKMSDVIAFSSNQSAPQLGCVKAVAFRYGRPIFCTQWEPQGEAEAQEALDNFARSHVYWYQKGGNPILVGLNKFKFIPISTPH